MEAFYFEATLMAVKRFCLIARRPNDLKLLVDSGILVTLFDEASNQVLRSSSNLLGQDTVKATIYMAISDMIGCIILQFARKKRLHEVRRLKRLTKKLPLCNTCWRNAFKCEMKFQKNFQSMEDFRKHFLVENPMDYRSELKDVLEEKTCAHCRK